MTLDEMIAVLTAAKEGKKIQFKRPESTEWHTNSLPNWNFGEYDYRVKPEPREFWINVYDGSNGRLWQTKEGAEQSQELCRTHRELIHVREVMDDK